MRWIDNTHGTNKNGQETSPLHTTVSGTMLLTGFYLTRRKTLNHGLEDQGGFLLFVPGIIWLLPVQSKSIFSTFIIDISTFQLLSTKKKEKSSKKERKNSEHYFSISPRH
jgi:hypothetical protein